ncbi:MAG: glycosyltransferase [Pseudooceanicola nanhaiensis]
MIRIGWFTPISPQSGIATYSADVLTEMKRLFPRDEVEVVVFHPETDVEPLDMPYATIALSESFLNSDFPALFDIAVYHLGNNSKHHAPIYAALMRHPGIVVLHDHVYQHYLAGVSLQGDHVGQSYVSLVQEAGGANGFRILRSSGVLRADQGAVTFVPWESEWATRVPLSRSFTDLGLATVVHSQYARDGLGADYAGEVTKLFMPRPEIGAEVPLPRVEPGRRIHIASCGHIGATKGLAQLLNAFIKAPELHEMFQITIAGFGSDTNFLNFLTKTIAEARLQGTFRIEVDPSDAEYGKVMTDADVFYNLRYPNTEGASLSLMEQLAHGRPVIAYRTGSFAEMPDAACYFLEGVGDEQELIALLKRIAADPADVGRRGAAARAAVADKTAAVYAEGIVGFVRDNMPAFRARMEDAACRAAGRPPFPATDPDWLGRFVRARQQMRDYYGGRLYIPRNFDSLPPEEKGQFILVNYLHTAPDRSRARSVGRLADGLDPIELHDLLGKLMLIMTLQEAPETFLPSRQVDEALPVTDRRFWEVLACLDLEPAIYLGVLALYGRAEQEVLDAVTERARQSGFKAALRERFDTDPALRASVALEGSELGTFLDEFAAGDLRRLPVAARGENLLPSAPAETGTPPLRTEGFGDPEPIGMWSTHRRASILLHPGETAPGGLSGMISLLWDAQTDTETVEITAEDFEGGPVQHTRLDFPAGMRDAQEWRLDPGDLVGPLRVSFEIGRLYDPADAGIAGDTRKLGFLLHEMRLDPEGLRESATSRKRRGHRRRPAEQ